MTVRFKYLPAETVKSKRSHKQRGQTDGAPSHNFTPLASPPTPTHPPTCDFCRTHPTRRLRSTTVVQCRAFCQLRSSCNYRVGWAGCATSTDLLHPTPDRPALSVACCAPSSVNPGKSLPSDPVRSSSKGFGCGLLVQNHVSMQLVEVIDSADSQAFTNSVCESWHS